MALDPKIVAKLKRDLAEINKIYKQIGEKPLTIDFDTAGVDDIKLVRDYLSEAKILTEDLNVGFGGMNESIKNIVREWKTGFADPTKEATKSFTKLKGLAEKFSDDATGLVEMKGKEVAAGRKLISIELKRLGVIRQELKAKSSLNDTEKTILANLESEFQVQEDMLKLADDRVAKEKKISKAMGLSGAAVKGIVGALGKVGIDSSLFDDVEASMRETAKEGNAFKTALTGAKGIAKGIGAALSDPLVVLTLLVKAVKFLGSLFDHVLKLSNKIGQSLGIAGKEARELEHQIAAAGNGQKDMFYFTDELVDAYISLNKAAGTNLKFNEENAKTYQDLTLYMGVSESAAAQLFKLSASTGTEYSKMFDVVKDTTQSLNDQGTFSMSTQDAIEAVAQASGTVRFNIKGGTEGLVKAAHTAARLGLTMDDIAAAAESHLDFESSIQKEIEAEMFLQKDLNLDKLRMAALTGDTATVAAEEARLIKENGHLLKGNVLAQQAFAAATGISMDKLGGALDNQDKLTGLKEDALDVDLASADATKTAGQEAQTFDRSMQNAANQLKQALLPIAEFIGPYLLEGAKFVSEFLGTSAGKGLMQIAGLALGGTLLVKAGQGIVGLFTKGMSVFGKLGSSSMNPMHVTGGGGGGKDDMLSNVIKLGTRNTKMGGFFKKFSNLVGGKNSMLGRQLRNFSAMALRRSSVTNQILQPIVKGSNLLTKVLPNLSTLNSGTKSVSEAAQATKVANAALQGKKVTDVAKVVNVTAKTTTAFSKVGTVLGAFTKKIPLIGAVLDVGIGGFTGASQANLTAEEQKEAGVKEGIGGVEATALGVLTGGAEKGSMFSETLGIEKGSSGDEALGIGMAGARGAMVGASVGAFLAPFTAGASVAVGAAIGGVIGTVGESFKVLSDPNSSMRKDLSEGIDKMGTAISDFGTKAWDKTKEWTGIAGEKISNFAGEAKESFMGFASETAESFKDFDTAKETLSSWASSASETISGFFSDIGGGISSLASGAKDMASKAGEFLSNTVSSVGDKIKNSTVGQAVSSAWGSVTGYLGFADGGIVTQPVKGMVGEAGPEAIIPLNQAGGILGSTEVIALLKELISTVNKGGNVYLDGAKVGYTLALQSSKMG